MTLKLSDIDVKTHAEARELMIKVANSLFFQIDSLLAIPITLITEKERRFSRKLIASMELQKNSNKYKALEYEYDEGAMAPYIYAKTADDKPLLQFLAYYQTIEYYFPKYSEPYARQQIEKITTDPSFNPSNEVDIKKLLDVIEESANIKSFKGEDKQLEYILNSYVNWKDLRDFIISEEKRKKFFF